MQLDFSAVPLALVETSKKPLAMCTVSPCTQILLHWIPVAETNVEAHGESFQMPSNVVAVS